MTDTSYRVEIIGQAYDPDTLSALATLFKTAEETIAQALANGNIVAKSGLSESDAETYKAIIEQRASADCILVNANAQHEEVVDTVKPPATKAHPETNELTSRNPRKAIIIASSIISTALIASAAFYLWISSPGYTLAKIEQSVQENDLESFRKFVDYKTLVESSVTTLETDDAGILLKAIEQAVLAGEEGPNPLESLDALVQKARLADNNEKQTAIHAPVSFGKFDNNSFEFIFELQKQGLYWQVAGISNLPQFMTWKQEQQAALLDRTNQAIRENIQASVSANDYEYLRMQKNPFLGPELRLILSLQNTGDKAIRTIYCNIQVLRKDNGELVAEQSLSWGDGKKKLKPGDSTKLIKDIGSFGQDELQAVLDDDTIELSIEPMVSSITFTDGSELVEYRRYQDIRQQVCTRTPEQSQAQASC